MTDDQELIKIYTEIAQGKQWVQKYRGKLPVFACILGFTETGLIPGISAAGSTPDARRYTAIADAEFLFNGSQVKPKYPLPPLDAGASPVLISRAVVEALDIPLYIFNAGLPQSPSVPNIDLGGIPAACLTFGNALPLATVKHLLVQGLNWGEKLAAKTPNGYVILGECVVGGTTTALSILTGLGLSAAGKVNSSHPKCNHQQKWDLVQTGLRRSGLINIDDFLKFEINDLTNQLQSIDPLKLVAAVGDPMQVVVAGMAIAASRTSGVLLAGGTQMLAVYALIKKIAECYCLEWQPEQIVVGTTRWVAEDLTGDTVGLASAVGQVPLIATTLSFAASRYHQLRVYEQGYVKEGVGAGASAIAAHLYRDWNQTQLLQAIESLLESINH
ncbi:MAG TPA: TIGR00303 family protein [Oculatellaceae cyanobacterium]|jgi:uncharacterized protein (TIGR00303 family)